MIQPQLVKSTQGMIRTPTAHKTLTPTTVVGDAQKKPKRKQSAGETCSPKPSLKIYVKQFKSSDTPIPPLSDDKERDEESYASEFVDLVFHDNNDFDNRIEPESNKDNLETVDDDDDEKEKEKQDDNNDDDVNDDHTDHTFYKTQEIELFQTCIHNNVITVHHITISSTATSSSADLQQQLYSKMKRSFQDQADDPELWEVLKRRFEKSSASSGPSRKDAFHDSDHDDHQEDDAPPEGEKRAKK
nr:hypothetical protein [Tanacetum cinerariifolium]